MTSTIGCRFEHIELVFYPVYNVLGTCKTRNVYSLSFIFLNFPRARALNISFSIWKNEKMITIELQKSTLR